MVFVQTQVSIVPGTPYTFRDHRDMVPVPEQMAQELDEQGWELAVQVEKRWNLVEVAGLRVGAVEQIGPEPSLLPDLTDSVVPGDVG